MKFKIMRDYLGYFLDVALTVPVGSVQSDELKSFFFQVKDSTLCIMRTDGELTVDVQTTHVDVLDDSPPSFAVFPDNKFYRLIKSLRAEAPEEDVIVEMKKHKFKVEAGGFSAEIFTVPYKAPHAFPIEQNVGVRLDADAFISAIDRVKYAAGQSEIFESFGQIMFGEGYCWAGDRSRSHEVVTGFPEDFEMALPVRASRVVRFIKLTGAKELFVGNKALDFYCFKVGSNLFFCRRPKVSFISRQRMRGDVSVDSIPGFMIERAKLINILERVGVTCEEGSKEVGFEISRNNLKIEGQDQYGNMSSEECPINWAENIPKSVSKFKINWERLVESLRAMGGFVLKFGISDKRVYLLGEGEIASVAKRR